MLASLFTVVPVGLVLGLMVFGDYGRRAPLRPTPPRVIAVGATAVLLGPIASMELGLFGWLVLLLILVAGILMVAMLRTPSPPLRG